MGRAFYRFGHDVALRMTDGIAFALKDAELGAIFGNGVEPTCFLRGSFTANSYRALIMRKVFAPNPEMQALAQPVAVKLDLKPELAAPVAKDAAALLQIGRRLDQNSLVDEVARKLLLFDVWQLVSTVPMPQKAKANAGALQVVTVDAAQDETLTTLIADMADELWLAAEEAGQQESEQQPSALQEEWTLREAVKIFFEEEMWETTEDANGMLRSVHDGENGRWVCYTQILSDLELVIFYSVCPFSVPSSSLPIMTEYLCRVNADLALGNFELDFSQNVVRFRTSVDVTDVGLAPLLFRNIVYQNLAVMDIYFQEMLGIIAGKQSALSIM